MRRTGTKRWRQLRARVLVRDGYQCQGCGLRGRDLEVDHIVPVVKGGSDDLDNLQLLCKPCHHEKTRGEFPSQIHGLAEWGTYARQTRFQKARPR